MLPIWSIIKPLGELLEKTVNSDRVVIVNAAKQVIYRGYADSADHAHIDTRRIVESVGMGMETYKKTDKMWDWKQAEPLAKQISVEQFSQFEVGQLEHILYIKIELANEYA